MVWAICPVSKRDNNSSKLLACCAQTELTTNNELKTKVTKVPIERRGERKGERKSGLIKVLLLKDIMFILPYSAEFCATGTMIKSGASCLRAIRNALLTGKRYSPDNGCQD